MGRQISELTIFPQINSEGDSKVQWTILTRQTVLSSHVEDALCLLNCAREYETLEKTDWRKESADA